MYVQAYWTPGHLNDRNIFDQANLTMQWGDNSNLVQTLNRKREGQTVQWPGPIPPVNQREHLLVIGGRQSIQDSFAVDPIRDWEFVPRPGEILSVTGRRKTNKRTAQLTELPNLGLKMLTRPELREPFMLKHVKQRLQLNFRTYTVISIVSAPVMFVEDDAYMLPPSTSGAQMSLLLRDYFGRFLH